MAEARERGGTRRRFGPLGPGLLVTAAFIGPGTVTTASTAGARFGFALLWALVFAVFAAVVLQEMCARLGVVGRTGLGEALRTSFESRLLRVLAIVGVVSAIAVGNAAFQTGNLLGAALGLRALLGGQEGAWAALTGALAAGLLATGSYRAVEGVLVGLVALMALVFLATAVLVAPSPGALLGGLVPSLPPGSGVTAAALIGTTVVPYNLFLHASAVQERWPEGVPTDRALAEARADTRLSIGLGGLVTLAVLATAAATLLGAGQPSEDAGDMARQLEPLLGPAARVFFAAGLLAAGLTSSVTAPLAAAYATAGALGWKRDLRDPRFKAVWAAIIAVGVAFSFVGSSPTQLILFAQAANGVLLPVVAVFLLVVVNHSDLLREHTNGTAANLVGALIVLVVVGLGAWAALGVLGLVG